MAEESKLELCASAVPKRVSKEHKTEKGEARNILEDRRVRATARTLVAVIYTRSKFISVY